MSTEEGTTRRLLGNITSDWKGGERRMTGVLGHMIGGRWQGLAFLHAAGLQARHPPALIRTLECSVASACVIRPYSNICSEVNDFIMPEKE